VNWSTGALSDVLVDVKSGFASGQDLDDGVFQFRMNNITTDGQLDLTKRRRVSRDMLNIERYAVRVGDVLFNATNSAGLVGKAAYFAGLDELAVFSNHFLRLRPAPALLDGRYLARWLNLQFLRGMFKSMARNWVNQATVNRDALLAMHLPLPSLAEQRRIADILDKADALRVKRRTSLSKLHTLTQSIFLDIFGDPTANPKQWPMATLASFGTIERGVSKHRPRGAPELLGGPCPLIQTGDVANCDGYIRTFKSTYSELGLRQSRMWPAGTLCITIAANIAKTGILTFDACFPDSVVGFRSQELATVEFIRCYFSFVQASLELAAPESAQKNINLDILRTLRVPVPPLNLQREFARRTQAIEVLRMREQSSMAELDALFASLQHRAFCSEL